MAPAPAAPEMEQAYPFPWPVPCARYACCTDDDSVWISTLLLSACCVLCALVFRGLLQVGDKCHIWAAANAQSVQGLPQGHCGDILVSFPCAASLSSVHIVGFSGQARAVLLSCC